MVIGGQVLAPVPPAGWKRFSTTSAHGGGDVSFCLDARRNTDLYLGALTYGLPSEGSGRLEPGRLAVISDEEEA